MQQRMGAAEQVVSTDFYTYGAFVTALAPNSSATTSIQIEADSDFEVIKMMQSTIAAFATALESQTQPVPTVNLMITDTGSGRNLFNIPTPLVNLFGSGELPFILPKSKVLFARSVLALTFYNVNSTVTYARIDVSFAGRKIFNRS